MKRNLIILAAVGLVAACGGGGGGPNYAPGTAGISWVEPRGERAEDRVFTKTMAERRDYSDVKVSQERFTQRAAMRALNVPGARVRGTSDGFIVSIPESPFFTHPASTINPNVMPLITRLAAAMHKDPSIRLDVIAHYHFDGQNRKALAESQKRAVAIQGALLSRSIGLDRVRAVGAGDQNPIAENNDPIGQRDNRRIDFHFKRG